MTGQVMDAMPLSRRSAQPFSARFRGFVKDFHLDRFFYTILALLGSIVFIIPALWMLSTSFKAGAQVWVIPPVWIPERLIWENYTKPWTLMPFPTFYRNTLTITVLNIIGITASSSIVAYGFARLRFRGKSFLFLLVLSTMMLPTYVTLIPQYVFFNWLGWINTFNPLIVPHFFGGAFNIFLLRQFMMSVPSEMDDAARIDGCSYFGIFWRIILPLSRAALGVVAINSFTSNWNAFMEPLVYLQQQRKFTVAIALRMLQGDYFGEFPVQYIMSMTFVSLIPVIITFFVAQRYFIQGIVISGVKG
jgi:ABC-type glycerol-3-phosphate transport system permease component